MRGLRPSVLGRRVRAVTIRRDRLVAAPSVAGFRNRLRGRRIDEVARRGKTLCFRLDDGGFWLVHLRMTGWFHPGPPPPPRRDRHVLATFRLDAGALYYRDPRRFGRMWWTDDPDGHFAGLGPEPLGRQFGLDRFAAALDRRRIPVKQALLDPALVAGVGNIYASEACFWAGIDPARPARSLDRDETAALRRSIRAVLRRAIRRGAVPGYAKRDEFRVYGRAGEPCPECGAPILRSVLGQRSTFSCGKCQA